MDFIKKLTSRHLLKDSTKINESFSNKAIYCGFDPTAPSLHLGHLATLNALVYASSLQYQPIAILGTSTALIGDPSGKSESRPLLSPSAITSNAGSISTQLQGLFENLQRKAKAPEIPLKVIENHRFYTDLNFVDFLRDFGYFFPVSPLLNRDFITQRADGVTYTEFSYSLLQAYDFFRLFQDFNCVGQLGGSDQWFNITSGTELIRKKTGKGAFGCTVPLLTTKDGKKFGKTEGNALFLQSSLTNPYDLYQYCFNQPDDIIEGLLYKLTFVTETEINEILKAPLEHRTGQKRLGLEILETVYSQDIAKGTQRVCELLFNEDYFQLTWKDFQVLQSFVKSINLTPNDLKKELGLLLKEKGIFASGKEARRALEAKSIKVNGKVLGIDSKPEDFLWIQGKFCVLSIGKKNVYSLVLEH